MACFLTPYPLHRLIVEEEENEWVYEPRPEWAKATRKCVYERGVLYYTLRTGWSSNVCVHVFSPLAVTPLEGTLSSLSALQQEALSIPRSALSGLELIGEGIYVLMFSQRLYVCPPVFKCVGKQTHSHTTCIVLY